MPASDDHEELIEVDLRGEANPDRLVGVPTLPRSVRTMPDPQKVANYLALAGWPVVVHTHPDLGCFTAAGPGELDPPAGVFLDALAYAGQDPVPCLDCFLAGGGDDCMNRRHRR